MLRMARGRLLSSPRPLLAGFSSCHHLMRPAPGATLLLDRAYASLKQKSSRFMNMEDEMILQRGPSRLSKKMPTHHDRHERPSKNDKSSSRIAAKEASHPDRKATPLPDQSELPPRKGSWDTGHPAAVTLQSLVDKVDGVGKLVSREIGRDWWGAMATAVIPGYGQFEAVAEAGTKAGADKTAFFLLLAQLNRSEVGEILWPPIEQLSIKDKKGEKLAIGDIFSYCARHLLIPKIVREGKAENGSGRSKRRRGRGGGARMIWKCTISLPEHNIEVMATSTSNESSEILAALKFKAAAEKYTAESGVSNLVIRDGASLTMDRARAFHEFMNLHSRGYHHKIDINTYDSAGYHEAKFRYQTKDLSQKSDSNPSRPEDSSESAKPMQDDLSDWTVLEHVVSATKKDTAENMAALVGAIHLCRKDPDLQQQFADALVEGGGRIVRPMAPIDTPIPTQALTCMELGVVAGKSLLRVDVDGAVAAKATTIDLRPRKPPITDGAKSQISDKLRADYEWYLESDEMAKMRQIKADLPMNQHKEAVFNIVQSNVYSIIIGATGSGKTTQVPQIILEQYYKNNEGYDCNIVCTQPRRIAATSVASRVADEMGPRLAPRVGHHVRFSSRLPQHGGSVTYCTTGILLQQLQAEPDRIFDEVSHLVIDEVHERDKIIDFTLTILKRAVSERLKKGLKVPKITLMSATLDTELFASYFKNSTPDGELVPAPILSVPGRTFPVTERYLDTLLQDLKSEHEDAELRFLNTDAATRDYLQSEQAFAKSQGQVLGGAATSGRTDEDTTVIDWKTKRTVADADDGSMVAASADANIVPTGLIATAIAHVLRKTEDGAVLVFFPGLDEMQKVEKLMRTNAVLGVNVNDTEKYRVYLLHSSIAESQQTVFATVPEGVRKIILSTNIGETSITIPDVKHVVDTGKARETQYDHVKRISALTTTWISKSNAKQRAGRAGRVQNGHYIGLYGKARHSWLRAIGLPELLRSDLQTTCLNIKSSIQGVGVMEFLADAIEPPSPIGVKQAIKHLVDLGAFTPEESLTPLGKLLASLPVHPALGKMILLGVLFRCLDPILVIGAAVEERSLFVAAPDVKVQSMQSKLRFAGDTQSDHVAAYRAFCEVRKHYHPATDGLAKKVAFDICLHFGGWRSIYNSAKQMEDIFVEAGLIPPNRHGQMFGGNDLNVNSNKPHIVKAVLLAGLQPNTAAQSFPGSHIWRTTGTPIAILPMTSTITKSRAPRNYQYQDDDHMRRRDPLVATFTNLVKSVDGKSTFLRDTSVVNPLAALMFGKNFRRDGGVIKVNNWLPLFIKSTSRRAVTTTEQFRAIVDRMMSSAFADLSKMSRGATSASTAVSAMHNNRIRNAVADSLISVLDSAEGMPVDEHRLRMLATESNSRNQYIQDRRTEWPGDRPESVHDTLPPQHRRPDETLNGSGGGFERRNSFERRGQYDSGRMPQSSTSNFRIPGDGGSFSDRGFSQRPRADYYETRGGSSDRGSQPIGMRPGFDKPRLFVRGAPQQEGAQPGFERSRSFGRGGQEDGVRAGSRPAFERSRSFDRSSQQDDARPGFERSRSFDRSSQQDDARPGFDRQRFSERGGERAGSQQRPRSASGRDGPSAERGERTERRGDAQPPRLRRDPSGSFYHEPSSGPRSSLGRAPGGVGGL